MKEFFKEFGNLLWESFKEFFDTFSEEIFNTLVVVFLVVNVVSAFAIGVAMLNFLFLGNVYMHWLGYIIPCEIGIVIFGWLVYNGFQAYQNVKEEK